MKNINKISSEELIKSNVTLQWEIHIPLGEVDDFTNFRNKMEKLRLVGTINVLRTPSSIQILYQRAYPMSGTPSILNYLTSHTNL